MTQWSTDQLDKIGRAEEVQIASVRRDGTLRKPVTVWVARHGDEAALWFVSEKPEPMGPTGGAPRRDRAVTVSRS